MAREKYERVAKHKNKKKRAFSLLLSIALILSLAVGGTLAYIITTSAMVENQFGAGRVSASVNEIGQVTNEGNVDAYIRAAVVVNWMDNNGNVYGIKPSYSVVVNEGWKEISGFYYYTAAVPAFGTTNKGPVTVNDVGNAPSNDYKLSIEIVAEAIQAQGEKDGTTTKAFQDAWKIDSIGN